LNACTRITTRSRSHTIETDHCYLNINDLAAAEIEVDGDLCINLGGFAVQQVNVRVIPTGNAIDESVDLAHEIYNRVFRKVPERLNGEKR
jgi:hypothetical protein